MLYLYICVLVLLWRIQRQIMAKVQSCASTVRFVHPSIRQLCVCVCVCVCVCDRNRITVSYAICISESTLFTLLCIFT